ncbi:MAG TPA: ABC transporter substrate-binding protein [Acidiphilium sp.]|nr:MAG: ABC transporter permease [Acidiphilium sp. 21-60-14]OYV92461.1 MAG: ABC transporter permease [Acidiphilium sp. 37-60-79]HQT87888.1 ABC transporter substrate-binding protein [Acidiphilium sp.]HQU22659.1 ABC transporter substrate-binding protein [Acidiphilium sp.]
MTISRRTLIGSAATGAAVAAMPLGRARAAGGKSIKIAVISDFSGPYRDDGGPTSVACVEQAVADFGATQKGYDVTVLKGDHQNKPDVGTALARQFYDQGVDLVIDVPNTAVAIAINGVAHDKNRAFIDSGAAGSSLTDKFCNAQSIHWTYDTYMLAQSTGGAMVKAGGKSWFFVTANYAFGHLLHDQTAAVVKSHGGTVVGNVNYPFPQTTDFSSFLIQAESSGAQVLGLANAGADTVNSIKQAHQFGLTKKMKIAGLLVFINDVHGMGLEIAQDLILTESFYWNLNDRTRAFTKRVLPRTPNNYPCMDQAGCYSGTLHFLKTVHAMNNMAAVKNGAELVAAMKKMPTDDDAFGKAHIREDGRFMCTAYLFKVKKPGESKIPWDYYNLLASTPANKAYMPMSEETACKLIKT